jgi:hypothetical protein
MKICRRGVAPFATGVSTNKYHMLPLCGTNQARRQALLGRPAIAGCTPMLPQCATSASLVRQPPHHPPSAPRPFCNRQSVPQGGTNANSPCPRSVSNCPARRDQRAKKQAFLQLSQLLINFCINLGLIAIIAIFPPISPVNFFSHELATLLLGT